MSKKSGRKSCLGACFLLLVLLMGTVYVWAEEKAQVQLVSVSPIGGSYVSNTPVFTLTFDKNVANVEVREENRGKVSFRDQSGNEILIHVVIADDEIYPLLKREIEVQVLETLSPGTYKLVVAAGVRAKNGTATGKSYTYYYRVREEEPEESSTEEAASSTEDLTEEAMESSEADSSEEEPEESAYAPEESPDHLEEDNPEESTDMPEESQAHSETADPESSGAESIETSGADLTETSEADRIAPSEAEGKKPSESEDKNPSEAGVSKPAKHAGDETSKAKEESGTQTRDHGSEDKSRPSNNAEDETQDMDDSLNQWKDIRSEEGQASEESRELVLYRLLLTDEVSSDKLDRGAVVEEALTQAEGASIRDILVELTALAGLALFLIGLGYRLLRFRKEISRASEVKEKDE